MMQLYMTIKLRCDSKYYFVLSSVDTFSLPVEQQGVWKRQHADTPTCLPFFNMKVRSPKEIEGVTNLIALQPFIHLSVQQTKYPECMH